MHYKFEGKNALVTGSSKGIGSGVALELAKGGANVTINCSSSVTQAEEVAEQIRRMGRKAIVVACDVSDQKAVEDMVQKTVDAFGSLDLRLVEPRSGWSRGRCDGAAKRYFVSAPTPRLGLVWDASLPWSAKQHLPSGLHEVPVRFEAAGLERARR